MKWLLALLFTLILILQYQLWIGDGSIPAVWRLNEAIATQKRENADLAERNRALDAEVKDLKQGLGAIEERARSELGMVRKDETFYHVYEE